MEQINSRQTDYSFSITANCSPTRAFEALCTSIDKWWGESDRLIQGKGDVFTVSWGEPWYQFKVTEFLPNEKISWECIDANQIIDNMEGVKKEWVGTSLHWSIKEINTDEIELSLIHKGLIPEIKCYEFCSMTWDSFLGQKLKRYLESS